MTAETRFRNVVNDGGLDDWLAERRRLGQDLGAEVWDGVYHVGLHARSNHGKLAHRLSAELHSRARAKRLNPTGEFIFGQEDDYRIPDMGWTSADVEDSALFVPRVEIVVEMESPGDETWAKVPFYFARAVAEVWVVSPHTRTVRAGVGLSSRPGEHVAAEPSESQSRNLAITSSTVSLTQASENSPFTLSAKRSRPNCAWGEMS